MTQPLVSSWHDPSDMQRSETSETPNNENAKDEMITDGGQQGLTLTLAPMGMVAPWRCQERQISGGVRQCLSSIGRWNHYFNLTRQTLDTFIDCRFD